MEFIRSLPNKGRKVLDTSFKRANTIQDESRKKIFKLVDGVRATGGNLHSLVGALSERFGYDKVKEMVLKYPKQFASDTSRAFGTLKKIATKQARRRKSTRHRKRNRYSRL